MARSRNRFEGAQAANDAMEEHLRRTQEFLEQSRRDIDALQGGVAETSEHIGISRRFIESSEQFLAAQRERLRGIAAGLARDGDSADHDRYR